MLKVSMLILLPLVCLIACNKVQKKDAETEAAKASSITYAGGGPKTLDVVLERLNVAPEAHSVLKKISERIRGDAEAAARTFGRSIHIVKSGTPEEKADLLTSVVETTTFSALPAAVRILAAGHPQKIADVESAMKNGLKGYFEKLKPQIAEGFRNNRFPPRTGPLSSDKLVAELVALEESNQIESFVAMLPPDDSQQTVGLARAQQNGNCSAFESGGLVRSCTQKEIGLKTMGIATGLIWAVMLAFVVSRTVALLLLVADISIFLYGAYLTWGVAVL